MIYYTTVLIEVKIELCVVYLLLISPSSCCGNTTIDGGVMMVTERCETVPILGVELGLCSENLGIVNSSVKLVHFKHCTLYTDPFIKVESDDFKFI